MSLGKADSPLSYGVVLCQGDNDTDNSALLGGLKELVVVRHVTTVPGTWWALQSDSSAGRSSSMTVIRTEGNSFRRFLIASSIKREWKELDSALDLHVTSEFPPLCVSSSVAGDLVHKKRKCNTTTTATTKDGVY